MGRRNQVIIASDPLSFFIIGILLAEALATMTIHIPFVKRVEMVSVALRIGVSAVKCFDNAVAASDELAFALQRAFDFACTLALATALILTVT